MKRLMGIEVSWRTRLAVAGVAGIVMLGGACAPGGDDPGGLDRAARALLARNGLAINGLAINGLAINGLAINGLAINGLAINGLTQWGAPLDAKQAEDVEVLLAYLAECALPAGDSVTMVAGNGRPRTFTGMFGLAPEWKTGPLTADGDRKVSACLAARSNLLGQSVAISLRHPEIESTDVEVAVYTTHEGAFWGSVFSDTPTIHVCQAQGGGLAGRVCAESGQCGFLFMGACEDVCASYDPVVGYGQCGDERATAVINTFLGLGSGVTFGGRNACGIDERRTLSCWGDDRYGQLGNGAPGARSAADSTPETTPETMTDLVPEPALVRALAGQVVEAAVHDHACARSRDGRLWCWGRNDFGQVGDGTRSTRHEPVHVADDVATFALGRDHTCAVGTSGAVQCWGRNDAGQLGLGNQNAFQAWPRAVRGLPAPVVRLARSTTARHGCALTAAGSVWCWGGNDSGQLGDGSRASRSTARPVERDVAGARFAGVTEMCASQNFTCARKSDGTLWCWGYDFATLPRQVAEGVAAEGLACAPYHACFVREDGTAWCLGSNEHGQLGHDTAGLSSPTPGQVEGLDEVRFVNASETMSCATRRDGSTWCWGADPGASTGAPSFPVAISPTPVDLGL